MRASAILRVGFGARTEAFDERLCSRHRQPSLINICNAASTGWYVIRKFQGSLQPPARWKLALPDCPGP